MANDFLENKFLRIEHNLSLELGVVILSKMNKHSDTSVVGSG